MPSKDKNRMSNSAVLDQTALASLSCMLWLICHLNNQSRTNGPINAHLTIAQV